MIRKALDLAPIDADGILAVGSFTNGTVRRRRARRNGGERTPGRIGLSARLGV